MGGKSEGLLEHYSRLMNLPEPWKVASVDLDVAQKTVTLEIAFPENTLAYCPECNQLKPVYDRRVKQWRHLSQMAFRTVVVCEVPRVDCEQHEIRQVLVPWAGPMSRFSLEFEAFAVEIMKATKSLTEAAALLRISWDAAQGIQKRAVERGKHKERKKAIPRLGIDEKSFLSRHRYATVLSDLSGGRVMEVCQGRDTEAAKTVLQSLSPEQRTQVKAIAMDFLESYAAAAKEMLPGAAIVHDRFHVTGYLTKAVDKVRKWEHKRLMEEGDERLKGTKYVWLTNPGNWTTEQKTVFRSLQSVNLKVGRAFALKEQFRGLWSYWNAGSARTFYRRWHFWATHSRLKPVIEAAATVRRHLEGIFNYFRHRISNAVAEGLNSKIQLIKSGARGFRNFENFRTAILFHCGGLELAPHNSR